MVELREEKAENSRSYTGAAARQPGKLLVLGWGSTYGVIKSAVAELQAHGHAISHAPSLCAPVPKNLAILLKILWYWSRKSITGSHKIIRKNFW